VKKRKEIALYIEGTIPIENEKKEFRNEKNTAISLIHGLIGTLVKPDHIKSGLVSGDQK
jgi:hypothetical protein